MRTLRASSGAAPGASRGFRSWLHCGCSFPPSSRGGPAAELRLSRFDELLWTILSGEWMTPVNVYAHKSRAGVELRQWLSATGDLFLDWRLAQWARHRGLAVERAPGPKPSPEYPLLSSVYRLTDAGRRLRDDGFQQLSDAPPLAVAGIEAYAPSSPWVLAEGDQIVRL